MTKEITLPSLETIKDLTFELSCTPGTAFAAYYYQKNSEIALDDLNCSWCAWKKKYSKEFNEYWKENTSKLIFGSTVFYAKQKASRVAASIRRSKKRRLAKEKSRKNLEQAKLVLHAAGIEFKEWWNCLEF